jgi:acyl transferase domain-containing protein
MVFITGYSGRFPSSDSPKAFWENLCKGKVSNYYSNYYYYC